MSLEKKLHKKWFLMAALAFTLIAATLFPEPALTVVKGAFTIPFSLGNKLAIKVTEEMSEELEARQATRPKTFTEMYRAMALQDSSKDDAAVSECYYRELDASMKNITYEKRPITTDGIIQIIKRCDKNSPLPTLSTNQQGKVSP